MAVAEMDRLFSSPYEDIQRARDLFELDNCLPPGMTLGEVDEFCLEARNSGLLVIAGNGSLGETSGAINVGVRHMMKAIKDKSLSRYDYRSYADILIQRVVDQVPQQGPEGVANIAISSRGGWPFERPLFERLYSADTGVTQQTRHEVTMYVDSVPSKMGDFSNGVRTFAADFMVATGGSMDDLIKQAKDKGADGETIVLGGFSTPAAIARLLMSEELGIAKIVTLPLEAGLIVLGEKLRNFIFGGVAKEFEKVRPSELQALRDRFMLGDHGNRYYKDLSSEH